MNKFKVNIVTLIVGFFTMHVNLCIGLVTGIAVTIAESVILKK